MLAPIDTTFRTFKLVFPFHVLALLWGPTSVHRASEPASQCTDRCKEGQTEEVRDDEQPAYNPNCHFRSGNDRARDAENSDHRGTIVFDNDFSVLYLDLHVDEAAFESLAQKCGLEFFR